MAKISIKSKERWPDTWLARIFAKESIFRRRKGWATVCAIVKIRKVDCLDGTGTHLITKVVSPSGSNKTGTKKHGG